MTGARHLAHRPVLTWWRTVKRQVHLVAHFGLSAEQGRGGEERMRVGRKSIELKVWRRENAGAFWPVYLCSGHDGSTEPGPAAFKAFLCLVKRPAPAGIVRLVGPSSGRPMSVDFQQALSSGRRAGRLPGNNC